MVVGVARASMILDIEGRLKGFDNQVIYVENTKFIYTIKKEKLSPQQQAYVKGLRSGAAIKLTLEREAIDKVSDQKKSKPL